MTAMHESVVLDQDQDADGAFVVRSTPWGAVRVGSRRGETGRRYLAVVSGDEVPTATVPIGRSLVAVARGVEGTLGASAFCVRRPKFGLHYRDRIVLVEADEYSMCCAYLGRRRILFQRPDGDVILEQNGRRLLLGDGVSRAETSLALVVFSSEIVQGSTLLWFLTA
jgi:hypothetical protein